jgi:DNA-binding CsgD family transcriptional regulator
MDRERHRAVPPGRQRQLELWRKPDHPREVAQTLFLSEKTVEAHLGHIYSKLEIGSRRELAAALAPA